MLKMFKSLIFLVVLGAVAWYAVNAVSRERRLTKAENEAVASFSAGEYLAALRGYELLLPQVPAADSGRLLRIKTQMAKCCVGLADNPKLSLAESVEWYRRALAHDPDSVKDPIVLRLLQSSPRE